METRSHGGLAQPFRTEFPIWGCPTLRRVAHLLIVRIKYTVGAPLFAFFAKGGLDAACSTRFELCRKSHGTDIIVPALAQTCLKWNRHVSAAPVIAIFDGWGIYGGLAQVSMGGNHGRGGNTQARLRPE